MSEEAAPYYKTLRLERDRAPDLVFEGRHIAEVTSYRSGRDMWTELTLYQAREGRQRVREVVARGDQTVYPELVEMLQQSIRSVEYISIRQR